MLRKIGANVVMDQVAYRVVRVDTDDVMKKLLIAHRAAIDVLARRPGTLFIGAQDFSDLMGLDASRSIVQFNARVKWGERGQYSIRGMRVVVVPWMTGVLPVTDDLVTRG